MSERSNVSIAEVLGDNYYIDKLTSSDYSPSVGDTVTITLLVKDVFGDPVTGQTRTVTCTGGQFVSMNGTSITASSSVEVTTGSGGTVTLGLSVSVADVITVSDGRAECVVSSLSDDTGWVTLTLASGFATYDSTTNPKVRKIGKTVQIRGAVKNTATITIDADNPKTVCTLPEQYRPSQQLVFTCQGSQMAIFALTINSGGSVTVSRYRFTNSTSSTYPSLPAGQWMPFSATYFIE